MSNAMTAGDVIARLREIPSETILTYTEIDEDRDTWYRYGIRNITPNGHIVHDGILASGQLSENGDA